MRQMHADQAESVIAGCRVCRHGEHQAPGAGMTLPGLQAGGPRIATTACGRATLGAGCRSTTNATEDVAPAMANRLVEQDKQAEVPPCWQRDTNGLMARPESRVLEPAQLYTLIALTFTLHVPLPQSGRCETCAEAWSCPDLRLAFRLREGF
jgi:hypothetical protein